MSEVSSQTRAIEINRKEGISMNVGEFTKMKQQVGGVTLANFYTKMIPETIYSHISYIIVLPQQLKQPIYRVEV